MKGWSSWSYLVEQRWGSQRGGSLQLRRVVGARPNNGFSSLSMLVTCWLELLGVLVVGGTSSLGMV